MMPWAPAELVVVAFLFVSKQVLLAQAGFELMK